MKTVCNLDMCCGCMACIDICTKNAIRIERDLDVYNAVIDDKKCMRCGECKKVCQNCNDEIVKNEPLGWYQGWIKDETRQNSSSGGVAAAIEKYFYNSIGDVYSCCYKNGEFVFICADSISDIASFAGSKYVKSNPSGVYKAIKEKLRNGKKILFIGLPCQVSAVKLFVGENLEHGLFTVDLICHGTPTPELLYVYLNQHGIYQKMVSNILFRSKSNFQLITDAEYITTKGTCDAYSIAFLSGLDYTENCYYCNYACSARVSDITLGDSWGSELPKEEVKKGISLILANTSKGKYLLNAIQIAIQPVDKEKAIKENNQLCRPTERNSGRSYFFKEIKAGSSFDKIIWKIFPWICFKQLIKSILIKSRIIGGGSKIQPLWHNHSI